MRYAYHQRGSSGRTTPARHNPKFHPAVRAKSAHSKRLRGGVRDIELPFEPPENWYEPTGEAQDYTIKVQNPGKGFKHVLTPDDVRERLSQLPKHFLEGLEVVQFSRMTRKKLSFPCYGMQWGATIYLYPMETNFTEYYGTPPTPNQAIEAAMYGGRWIQEAEDIWKLAWSEESIKDFYLNNILIHELGHLVDDRNSGHHDRERFAEWFALEYGYKATRASRIVKRKVVRRHHKPRR